MLSRTWSYWLSQQETETGDGRGSVGSVCLTRSLSSGQSWGAPGRREGISLCWCHNYLCYWQVSPSINTQHQPQTNHLPRDTVQQHQVWSDPFLAFIVMQISINQIFVFSIEICRQRAALQHESPHTVQGEQMLAALRLMDQLTQPSCKFWQEKHFIRHPGTNGAQT